MLGSGSLGVGLVRLGASELRIEACYKQIAEYTYVVSVVISALCLW